MSEKIAASVAMALCLSDRGERSWYDGAGFLYANGCNVFDCYWRTRCEDWLLERGSIELACGYPECNGAKDFPNRFVPHIPAPPVAIYCPASEFCARAIHELMKP